MKNSFGPRSGGGGSIGSKNGSSSSLFNVASRRVSVLLFSRAKRLGVMVTALPVLVDDSDAEVVVR